MALKFNDIVNIATMRYITRRTNTNNTTFTHVLDIFDDTNENHIWCFF